MLHSIYLILFSLPLFDTGGSITGEVTSIYDGNTVEISTSDNVTYRVVLAGIDCPELQQAYGKEAKEFLTRWLLNEEVIVKIQGKDRSQNYVGVVLLTEGADVRVALLEEGLAWTSERNAIPEFETIRQQAAKKRKGLWREHTAVPPWIFRREQSMLEAKSR